MPSIIGKFHALFQPTQKLDRSENKESGIQTHFEKRPGFSERLAQALGLSSGKPKNTAKDAVSSRTSAAHANANIKNPNNFSDKELFVAAMLSMASQEATPETMGEGVIFLTAREKAFIADEVTKTPPPADDPGPPPPQYDPGLPPPQEDPGPPPPSYDPGPPPPNYDPGPPPPNYIPAPPSGKQTIGQPPAQFTKPPSDPPPALPPGFGINKR